MKIIIYQNREVYKEDSKIGNDSENKVETLEFEFPEEYKDFTKYIEFQIKGEKYVDLIENDKYTITRAIAKYGKIKTQIVLRNSIENDVAVFKSDVFELKVSNSINATIDVPIEYPTWIDNLTRLKQDIEKSEETRVLNENKRVTAEKARVETFNQMGQDVENAIGNIVDLQKAYDKNAEDKIKEFNDNAENQLEAHNTNAENKAKEFNDNVTTQTNIFNQNVEDKISEFDRNAQDKLDEYNKNTETLENRIVELESQVVELETENENIKNQIPVGQAEGENITLNDSSDMEFKEFVVGGNSWQETRSGKNLFNIQNAIARSNITISPNGTVSNIEEVNSITKARCQYFKDNVHVGNGSEVDIIKGKNSVSFTKQSTFDSIAFGVKSSPYDELVEYDVSHFENNKTYTISFEIISLTNTSVSWNNIQIEEGNVATEYEPYGAMPSPEFRSEIRNVGENGSANTVVTTENFCPNIKEWILKNGAYLEDGYIVLPEETSYATITFPIKYIETLYFKGIFNVTNGDITPNIYIVFNYLDANLVRLGMNGLTKNITSANTDTEQFNILPYSPNIIPANTRYITLQIQRNSSYAANEYKFKDILVAESEMSYTEHQSQQITFPLSEGQRMYKDSYLADDGVHHKRGRYVFKAVDHLSSYMNNLYGINQWGVKSVNGTDILSDRIIGDGNWKENTGYITGYGQTVVICGKPTDTVASFNERYEGTIIEYPLENEAIEPYTEEQQLVYNEIKKAHSYKNVTHIFSTDEIKPIVKTIYRKDLETHINNEIDKRTNALTNAIIELGGTVNV